MLHISVASDDPKELGAKYLVSPQFSLAVPDIVPVNLVGSHLITPVIPINELGKQLLKAAAEGNVEELKTLMSKGAPFTADWLGTTPLHLAAQNNHLEICRILLRAGISRDAKTKVDRTPLHMAAAEGNLEIVETLLLHGAICNCRDMLAMTPLHWAAQNGHADIVVVLLKYGAAADVVNKFNLTPADIAKQIDRLDIVDLLLAPSDTSEHLSVQLSNDEDSMDLAVHNDIGASAVETVLLEDYSEDEDSPQPVPVNNKCDTLSNETLNDDLQVDDNSESFSESLKLLQQHGITMLPNEDNNILSSIMESGHSVVLTDIGKEVLNSVKLAEPKLPAPVEPKAVQKLQQNRIITLTPEQFLEITSNGMLKPNWVKALNGKTSHSINKPVKTVVMKKNKTTPVFKTSKSTTNQDLETVMKQLIEARKVIQEYKLKLSKKEAEAEKYKQQLKIILGRQ